MSRNRASPFPGMGQGRSSRGRASMKPARYYDEEDRLAPVTRVELGKLKIGALRRYAAVFRLDVSGTCTRDELTRAIGRHWDEQVLSEGDVLLNLAVALRKGDPASPSQAFPMYQYQQQQQAPLPPLPLQPHHQQQQQAPLPPQQQQFAGAGGVTVVQQQQQPQQVAQAAGR